MLVTEMFDCAPTTRLQLLEQLGIDVWETRADCQIWLAQYPETPAAWQLLDAILAVLKLHRADLQVRWGGVPPLAMDAPALVFADAVADALPSLATLLASPKAKALVWQRLQTLI